MQGQSYLHLVCTIIEKIFRNMKIYQPSRYFVKVKVIGKNNKAQEMLETNFIIGAFFHAHEALHARNWR